MRRLAAEREPDRAGAIGERLQVVAALDEGYYPPLAALVGHGGDGGRQPDELPGGEAHAAERIVGVRVEARGHQDQPGRELPEHGERDLAEDTLVVGIGCAGGKWQVHGETTPASRSRVGRGARARVVRILV